MLVSPAGTSNILKLARDLPSVSRVLQERQMDQRGIRRKATNFGSW
ncbi:MAG: hypothetical protein HY471_00115 [Candidatus Sungbacteria bacterium]|nr:hypothetical protein [Candidatus Sungbacteria bacterium]